MPLLSLSERGSSLPLMSAFGDSRLTAALNTNVAKIMTSQTNWPPNIALLTPVARMLPKRPGVNARIPAAMLSAMPFNVPNAAGSGTMLLTASWDAAG